MNDDHEMAELELGLVSAGLHGAVLSSWQELSKKHPDGVIIEAIGLHAWEKLDHQQRIQSLPFALGTYVMRVLDDDNLRVLKQAARDATKTYLGENDVATLHDSLDGLHQFFGKGQDTRAEVDAEALSSVLAELELLQHRVAMLRQQAGGDQ